MERYNNIIGLNDQILHSGAVEKLQLVNYNIKEDKFTIILPDGSHQVDRDLNEKIFSSDNSKVIYSQFVDKQTRDISKVYLRELDYENKSKFDRFNYYDDAKVYKYQQTELVEGFLKDILWHDNEKAIFSVSDSRFEGDYKTYLLKQVNLVELPIKSKKLIGVINNSLIYTNDGSIEGIRKFKLTQALE